MAPYLVAVPIDHGGVQLEGQAGALAGLDAGQGERMGVRKAAELVVLGGIQAVHGDAMAAAPASFRRRATSSVMSVPLLPNTGASARCCGAGDELENVVAHKRLAAAENHDFEASACDLRNHRARFFG